MKAVCVGGIGNQGGVVKTEVSWYCERAHAASCFILVRKFVLELGTNALVRCKVVSLLSVGRRLVRGLVVGLMRVLNLMRDEVLALNVLEVVEAEYGLMVLLMAGGLIGHASLHRRGVDVGDDLLHVGRHDVDVVVARRVSDRARRAVAPIAAGVAITDVVQVDHRHTVAGFRAEEKRG